jgi:hypothetical protein
MRVLLADEDFNGSIGEMAGTPLTHRGRVKPPLAVRARPRFFPSTRQSKRIPSCPTKLIPDGCGMLRSCQF